MSQCFVQNTHKGLLCCEVCRKKGGSRSGMFVVLLDRTLFVVLKVNSLTKKDMNRPIFK